MSRTAVRLTLDNLDAIPAPCRSCLFWECDPVRRERLDDPAAEKQAWVSEVLREWGSCGRVAIVDDRLVGHIIYAPAGFVPGSAGFATSPISPDAVLLTTVHVDPTARGGGVGRMLVRAMARDLVERDIRAVEAFGHHGGAGATAGPVHGAGGLPQRCRLPDPPGAPGGATDADGPAHRPDRGAARSRRPWNGWSEWSGRHRNRDAPRRARRGRRTVRSGVDQAMTSASSLSSAALGRAPTIDFTTSPPW